MKQTTFPWIDLRRIRRARGSRIDEVIDHIVHTGHSDVLHGATMHDDLRIGRSRDFVTEDGELQIKWNKGSDEVLFRYYDSARDDPWCKACEGNEVIPTFTHVITKRLRWIRP